ncbi:hypothetical protein LTR95_013361, partial [Oleoguttula sp. CCFEE 5521]
MPAQLPQLQASAYNELPFLEQQPCLPPPLLKKLGQLFVHHKIHSQWGMGIVHRHLHLPQDHHMVHTRDSTGLDTCEPRSSQYVDFQRMRPSSILLHTDDCFRAYEYEPGTPDNIPPLQFFESLRDVLAGERLARLVALIASHEHRFDMEYETVVHDRTGAICAMRSTLAERDSSGFTDIVTAWQFRESSGVEA